MAFQSYFCSSGSVAASFCHLLLTDVINAAAAASAASRCVPPSPSVERLRTSDSGCRSADCLASQRWREVTVGMMKVTEATQEGHKERKNIREEERSKQQRNGKVFQHTHQFYINLIICCCARGNETAELHKPEIPKFQHYQGRLRNVRVKKPPACLGHRRNIRSCCHSAQTKVFRVTEITVC